MPEHELAEIVRDEVDFYVALCSCEWFSNPCPDRDTARECYEDHLEWAIEQASAAI